MRGNVDTAQRERPSRSEGSGELAGDDQSIWICGRACASEVNCVSFRRSSRRRPLSMSAIRVGSDGPGMASDVNALPVSLTMIFGRLRRAISHSRVAPSLNNPQTLSRTYPPVRHRVTEGFRVDERVDLASEPPRKRPTPPSSRALFPGPRAGEQRHRLHRS